MFSAPLSLTTETAFELPGYLNESGADNAWVAANLHGKDVASHLAASCLDGEGRLWVTDLPFGRIFRVTPTGEWDLIVKYDGWPAGLAFHPDGRLVVADQRHGLLALEVESRKLSPLVTHAASARFRGVADLVFADDGDLYFSDAGQSGLHDASGAVWRLDKEGDLVRLMDGLPGPAGLALNAAGNVLWIAVTGDNAIWRAPLVDGAVSRAGRYIQLSAGAGPVGIAADPDDNLYVAHMGLGCAWQFDKRGEARYRIDSSRGDGTRHVARDPRHPGELFITDAQTGTILRATLPMY